MTQQRWSLLSATHPCYDDERIGHMKLLYKGGYDLQESAKQFLKPMHQESMQSYDERLKTTSLRPYLTKFVNIYKSNLFSVELTVHAAQDEKDAATAGDDSTNDEFYKLFLSNCDGCGTSFHEFMKEKVYLPAEVCEYGYVGVDLPVQTQSPANRLQEEMMGLDKPYLYQIDPCDVWDWECDAQSGKYNWIKLGYRIVDRPNPFSPWMHYWKICVFRMQDGVQVWETYQTPLYDDDKDPKPEDIFPMVDSGVTSFKEISVFCLDLSNGESLGYMLGPMVKEDYQMTSLENAYTTKACLTIPWVKLSGNLAGLPNDTKKSRGADPRGQFNAKGFIALNAGQNEGDSIGIAETTGTALKFLHLQSEDRKEQMHEIAHQLHSASKQTSSKTGRSAAAMKESRYQMEITLSDRASQVWKLARDIFTCISRSRDEDIVWAPKGLCTETPPDMSDLQKALQNLSKYSIGSDLADKKIRFKLATGVLGKISSEEQEQIRRDINDAVERNDNVELYGPAFDAKLQQAINATSQVQAPGGDNPTSDGQSGSDPASMDDDALPMVHGHPQAPEGAHLQTGEHISSQTVYDQLSKDYQTKDIEFVKYMTARGPVSMPTSSIDDSNQDNWASSQPDQADHVSMFADKFKAGDSVKPIVLFNNPENDNKMYIIDGHHRFLAAKQAGVPVPSYVLEATSDHGPWEHLHTKQMGSMQKPNQMEGSLQKEASKQADKSALAPEGKTK